MPSLGKVSSQERKHGAGSEVGYHHPIHTFEIQLTSGKRAEPRPGLCRTP